MPVKYFAVMLHSYILCLFCSCDIASSEDSDTDSTDSDSSSSKNKAQDTAAHEQPKTQDTAAHEQPARVLSDEEMNQLGAKILRAEMMGDEVHFF